ncbi:MAG: deoxynucleoside kinase [Chitinophagaceae bacterium]
MANHIAIEGNIGAGKTSLASVLAERLNARLVLEQFADNTFLPKFYKDPERYAFPLELSFLAERYKQILEFATTPDLFQQTIVSDYLFIKSKLFARINLEDAEYDLFSQVYRVMDLNIRPPDVLLFLHAPVGILQAHIRQRGRSYEQEIQDAYLEKVAAMYENHLTQLEIPVIIIDTSTFHFQDKKALESLLVLLRSPLQPRRYYLGSI